jgi:hypothetical protein
VSLGTPHQNCKSEQPPSARLGSIAKKRVVKLKQAEEGLSMNTFFSQQGESFFLTKKSIEMLAIAVVFTAIFYAYWYFAFEQTIPFSGRGLILQ